MTSTKWLRIMILIGVAFILLTVLHRDWNSFIANMSDGHRRWPLWTTVWLAGGLWGLYQLLNR